MKRPILLALVAAGSIGVITLAAQYGFRPNAGANRLSARERQQEQALNQQATGAPPAKAAADSRDADEIPAERASAPSAQADFPALAITGDGATWVAYLEWNGGKTDRIVVRRKSAAGVWGQVIELADGCFEHYVPAIAARGNRVLAVWSGHNNDGFDLYTAEIAPGGNVSDITRLTTAPHSDFNVRAASDAKGNVTIAWQSFRDGQADIFTRRLSGDAWGDSLRVSPSVANDWEPAVAVDAAGRAWISWDSYEHGNYDVFLRSFDGQQLGELVPVTTEATAQFHSTVSVDSRDRVWVAWDEADINWGKDFSRTSAAAGSRGLHFSRRIDMRVFADGRLLTPEAELQTVLSQPMQRYAELPHLRHGRNGTLWMVFRHWTIKKPHEMFHFYATRLTEQGWSEPVRMGHSSGRNTQHAAMAVAADGSLRVAYSSDGRAPDVLPQDPIHALPYVTYVAALPLAANPGRFPLQPVTLPPSSQAPPRRPRSRHTVGDVTYELMFGDCHRHTDIRGHSGVDGSALDTYRYALDAAQLDFLGLGDHNQVTKWPDGLRDYHWWYQQKFVDLFTHAPRFIGIYSYEHSLGRPAGHRNMLHLKRGAPMRVAERQGNQRNPDNQPPNLWKWAEENVLTQPGQRLVIVPHTFASGPLADFNWKNPEFDCLLEIYQGARGSYEAWRLPKGEKRGPTQTDEPGHFARDALAKGNVYGFVCFSDHGSTHNSWAGVWVRRPTREGIFEGMLAKRTFGASDEMILRVSAIDVAARPRRAYAVGEHFTAKVSSPPQIEILVEAPDVIYRIDVVKDGRYVYTARPQARRFQAAFTDMDVEPGAARYYVRVFQRDPEQPGGDPEIGWASPFFVTYE